MSTINSPSSKLNKYLSNILSNLLIDSKYNLKNSEELVEELRNLELSTEEHMFSFDVVSLFTNIPLDLAIECIMKRWNSIKKFTKIPEKDFENLLKFCLIDNNYFIYEENHYKQLFGLAMGNNLSPIAAHFVMEDLIDFSVSKMPFNIKYFKKYVDDLLVIIPPQFVEELQKTMNSFNHRIKFTVESENESKELNYLDITLKRKDNEIKTNWFSKEISSNRLLNFLSSHPHHMKKNVALNFAKKVLFLSDEEFHLNNIIKIRKILKLNNYPNNIINRVIKDAKFSIMNNRTMNQGNIQEPKRYIQFPYVPQLTEKIQNQINNFNPSIRFGLSSLNKLQDKIFSNTKTKVAMPQVDVVYCIPCKGNENISCDKVYIGETSRDVFLDRKVEHVRDLENARKNNLENHYKTALVEHSIKNNHNFDFEKIKILERTSSNKTRKTTEAFFIEYFEDKSINFKRDTELINPQIKSAFRILNKHS